jgi:hypothetical protein
MVAVFYVQYGRHARSRLGIKTLRNCQENGGKI